MRDNRYNPNEEAMRHAANGNIGDQMPAAPELRCGSCDHFRPRPPDPSNLGGPRRGLCVEGPPAATIMQVQDRFGNVSTLTMSAYPDLTDDFAACHRHKPRIALAVSEEG